MLAFADGDSRIEIPTAPTKNPMSETVTSTLDDADLLKDLKGLGKPPLFDGNETDVSFFLVSEDDSILLRRMDDVVDTGPDEHHRAIGEMADQMNQHIKMAQIQFTKLLMSLLRKSDKFRREPPRPRHPNTLGQWPASVSGMTEQVETQTRTSKAKPLPNTAGQKGRIR